MQHTSKLKLLYLVLIVFGGLTILRPLGATTPSAVPVEAAEVAGGHVTASGAFYAEPPASPTRVQLGVPARIPPTA